MSWDLPTEVLVVIPARAELDRVLAGWDVAMQSPDGVAWLRERIARYESGVDLDSSSPAAPTWPTPTAPPHEIPGRTD